MNKKIIKQDIEDLKRILNNHSSSDKLSVFERIELYTEIYESNDYKNYKQAIIDGKTEVSNSIMEGLPYTKRALFKQLVQRDIEYFDKM